MTQYRYKISNAIGGSHPDPFSQSSTQLFPFGTILEYGERKFRYAQMDGAVTAGKLLQSSVAVTNHVDLNAQAAASAGDTSVSVTLGGTLVVENQYAEGYLHVNDNGGQGQLLRIKQHPAADASATLTLTLYDKVTTALTTLGGSKIDLIKSNFKDVVVAPATETGAVVGVTTIDMTDNYYGWIQVSGPCSVLTSGTLVVGHMAVRSDTLDGAVEPNDPASGPSKNTSVGHVLHVNGNNDNSIINLNLE
jgi:hypothetical protein